MLQLKKICKNYKTGDFDVKALRDIDLSFRDSEFVSILGPSGCGKTTLLNLIGGLDRYSSGDLIINGRSTKEFKDRDWDNYRNHSIGFVFQTYNLIPHQTVLSNVELALTLSGVSKSERRKRAIEALTQVGLGDQIKKKPNQMSGGQMQRVAIARALVNNPDILLADEPTGALDSETSVQVMEILRSIAKDRLIIMVTHNAELAEQYSTRIVSLLDGKVVKDTMPYSEEEATADLKAKAAGEKAKTKLSKKAAKREKKANSMSFFTALSLSFNNLMTKRARTFLTSFAGSIGIIGIALILAMSTGVQAYINKVQKDTLSSYPITIEAEQADLAALMEAMGAASESTPSTAHGDDAVYISSRLYDLFNSVVNVEVAENDLASFKEYLDSQMKEDNGTTGIHEYISSVQYRYPVSINTYVSDANGNYVNTNVSDIFSSITPSSSEGQSPIPGAGSGNIYSNVSANFASINLWQEILPGKTDGAVSDLIHEQYDLLYGEWPEEADEIVVILDKNNEISDLAFFALGVISEDEIRDIFSAVMRGQEVEAPNYSLEYEDLCKKTFRVITDSDYYADNDGDGIWEYIGDNDALMNMRIKNALELKITGVIRPNDEAVATALTGTFGYTSKLTSYLIEKTNSSDIVKAQIDEKNKNTDVLTGLPFVAEVIENPTDEYKAEKILEYIATLTDSKKVEFYKEILATPAEEVLNGTVDQYMQGYSTREKMEELIMQSFGLDKESVKSYVESYTDDELSDLIREQIVIMIKEQYKTDAENTVSEMMTAPSAAELGAMSAQIISGLKTTEEKYGLVIADWTAGSSMSQTAAAQYLMTLTPAQFEEALTAAANRKAAEIYASMPANQENGIKKVVAKFDGLYNENTDLAVLAKLYDSNMPSSISGTTLKDNLKKFGYSDTAAPSAINIYAESFEDKELIADFIAEYNAQVDEEKQITYTDYVALLMSGVVSIIDAISYGLIIFVSVSLVVSSIMIGIITYISVLERTKEIGILRAIGASKKDISRVFNAETLIIGFTSGMLGITISLILCIPISMIVHALSGITAINAFLEPSACIALVAISMFLTFISGLIPSGIASKKDPVEALRTE